MNRDRKKTLSWVNRTRDGLALVRSQVTKSGPRRTEEFWELEFEKGLRNYARSSNISFHASGALWRGAGDFCGAGPRGPDRRGHRVRRGFFDAGRNQLRHPSGDFAADGRQDCDLLREHWRGEVV